MEYHCYPVTDPFNPMYSQNKQFKHGRSTEGSLEEKLKENKQRREEIAKSRQRHKQQILMRRRERQENAFRKVIERRQDRDKQAHKNWAPNIDKNVEKVDSSLWKKENIEEKIDQCRMRADYYKTMYKKKIQQENEIRQRSVRARRNIQNDSLREKSQNFHLAEWRNYEKKIIEKYKGEVRNPLRLFQAINKKQVQLKQILEKVVQEQKTKEIQLLKKQEHEEYEIEAFKKKMKEKQENPIFRNFDINQLGLSKSVKNPEKFLKSAVAFLRNNLSTAQIESDEHLKDSFSKFLMDQDQSY